MTDLREQAIYLYTKKRNPLPMDKIATELGVSLWYVSQNLLKGIPRRIRTEWFKPRYHKPKAQLSPDMIGWRIWILLSAGRSIVNIEAEGIGQAQALKILWDYSGWIQCPRCGIATTNGKLCAECVRELEKEIWIPWPTQRMKNPAYLTETGC